MEEERLRPPSPPPVVHYTDHEATSVSEKIKQDDTFTKAVQVCLHEICDESHSIHLKFCQVTKFNSND